MHANETVLTPLYDISDGYYYGYFRTYVESRLKMFFSVMTFFMWQRDVF